MRIAALALALAGTALTSCSTPYYAVMEKFGVEKRDILVDRVVDAREDQVDAQEQFKTTLESFQELTGDDGGDLGKAYKKFSSEYDDSVDAADDVTERIGKIEKVAGDLFSEWEGELEKFTNQDSRRRSEQQLSDTKDRYGLLLGSMKKAEASMQPVLAAFQDQVLSLKHSLNAQAISSLEGEVMKIEGDVGALIENMERSIAEADQFIKDFEGA